MGSPTETITITSYAPDRKDRLEATLAADLGLKMTGNEGEIKYRGADVKYAYDPTTQTLVLTVLHGPHLHSFDAFCAELKARVEAQV
jgi:hypothetical protein